MSTPIGAHATVLLPDTDPTTGLPMEAYVYLSFGVFDPETDADLDSFGVDDERVFFYTTPEELASPDLHDYIFPDGYRLLSYEMVYDPGDAWG